jgi:acetyl esterase/lipase
MKGCLTLTRAVSPSGVASLLGVLGLLAAGPASAEGFTLPILRQKLQTKVSGPPTQRSPAPKPPVRLFEKVIYRAPLGMNVAYVTPIKSGARRPAMLWIAGGLDWNISEAFWAPAERDDDQSARAFREAGMVLMLPSLRGSNQNPGHNECFLGEVDDILAAADFLARRPDVDPKQIYLGGHSTGGTLALLAAESSGRFRAVFAFGPVADPRDYGLGGCLPADAPAEEVRPRSPVAFVSEIQSPTFVIEGHGGNMQAFPALEGAKRDAPLRFLGIPGATHFSVLGPGSEAVAAAIMAARSAQPLKLDTAAIEARLHPARMAR